VTAPEIVAFDLSLTATGVATNDGPVVLHTRHSGVERLAWFREQCDEILIYWYPYVVVIEDYAFSRAAAHSHQLGELGGVIRLQIHDRGIPTVEIVPSALKKWLTGKGNAGKDDMVAVAARLGCPVNNNNAVDAWALREMALYAYGHPGVPVTDYRDEAVAKITWPAYVVLGAA
jgi:crossover junction endodeoxyribonuclease RuvC